MEQKFEMDVEHEKHLQEIKDEICKRIDAKYRRGVAEHGGYLWKKPVLDYMQDEVTDLVVYFLTLQKTVKEKIKPEIEDLK